VWWVLNSDGRMFIGGNGLLGVDIHVVEADEMAYGRVVLLDKI